MLSNRESARHSRRRKQAHLSELEQQINSCNGFYCDYFSPNKNYKPKLWTEAWSGWYTKFGGPAPHRPVEDLAFAVARFIQKGGSFINYYMAPQLLKWIISQLKICLHSPVGCFLWPTIILLESCKEVTRRHWMFNWI